MEEESLICSCNVIAEQSDITTDVDSKAIIVDFGKVPIRKSSQKYVILDESLIEKGNGRFNITSVNKFNKWYTKFKFNKTEDYINIIKPYKLKMIYKPNIANEVNVEEYILRTCKSTIKFLLKGESIGPRLVSSVNNLVFYVTETANLHKKRIEITNPSQVIAVFEFYSNVFFEFEPRRGSVNPGSNVYIFIKFVPKKPGIYAERVTCLIVDSKPFNLELIGYFSPKCKIDVKDFELVIFPYPLKDIVGYEGFLSDVVEVQSRLPPVTISAVYLDFGVVNVSDTDTLFVPAQIVSLSNHLDDDIRIEWLKNSDNDEFNIVPSSETISQFGSFVFECNFKPKEKRKIYREKYQVVIHWKKVKDEKVLCVPITYNLQLFGQTFPENEVWISAFEIIPNVLIMPPTIPMQTCHSSILLKVKGHLPAFFKLIPPSKTYLTIKPSMGVTKDFQIVIVELQPIKTSEYKQYEEQWFLEVNGQKDQLYPIFIIGEVSVPRVCLGFSDEVDFGHVHPGNEEVLEETLKNVSDFRIQYKFVNHSYIDVFPIKGELAPNETVIIRFVYTVRPDAPTSWIISVDVHFMQNSEIIGKSFTKDYIVKAICSESQLCTTPKFINCMDLLWGSTIETDFYVFNYGLSKLHFQLKAKQNSSSDQFTLNPNRGTVHPGSYMKINVNGVIKSVGYHEVIIQYETLPKITLTKPNGKPIDLFHIEYYCDYPKLQVVGIIEHNFGNLFTKWDIWEMFQIRKLNIMMQKIRSGERQKAYFNLPVSPISDEVYSISILISNRSHHDTTVNLRRYKTCNCKLVPVPGNITRRKFTYDCVHRNVVTMEFLDPTIFAHKGQILKATVKYCVTGKFPVVYLFEMSNDRTIEINFQVNCIPIGIPKLCPYSRQFVMQFQNSYVGEREAPFQVFWFYNNTREIVSYRMILNKINELNNSEGFPIIQVKNPSGYVQPLSSHAIVFVFHPNQIKTFKVVVPLQIGQSKVDFILFGRGVLDPYFCIKSRYPSPDHDHKISYRVPTNFISVSVDTVDVEMFGVWSSVEKVFFIRNLTSDKVIYYKWGQCGISQLILVKPTYNETGYLKPKELRCVKIQIQTFNAPFKGYLRLTCEYTDYYQHVRYQKDLEKRNKKKISTDIYIETEQGDDSALETDSEIETPTSLFYTIIINVHVVNPEQLVASKHFENVPQNEFRTDFESLIKKYTNSFNRRKSNFRELSTTSKENINIEEKMKRENVNSLRIIMECIISEMVFSETFRESWKLINECPPPYYAQFVMSDDNSYKDIDEFRRKECLNYFRRPPNLELVKIFRALLTDSLQDMYRLGGSDDGALLSYLEEKKDTCPCLD